MNLSAMTREQLEAMVQAYNNKPNKALAFRVSKAGAMSIYGLGRFPVTLYPKGMRALLAEKEAIEAFLDTNAPLFSQGKDDPRFAKVAE